MYKLFLTLLSLTSIVTITHAQQKMNTKESNNKILIAYFSATGTTARAAEKLADITGGTLYEITPAKPYTNADLDWNNKQSRSSQEMKDAKLRPEIGGKDIDITQYEIIFIGYPIWWNLAPRIINTFIEKHDMNEKTVIPFATSGGSSITNSVTKLKTNYPKLEWKEGRLLNHYDEQNVRTWIDKLNINSK